MEIALAGLAGLFGAAAVAAAWYAHRLGRRVDALAERVQQAESAGPNSPTHVMAAITHDLRTPLAAILGYQELLADGIYGDLDARVDEAIARVGRASEQLRQMIDGMDELAATDGAEPVAEFDPSPLSTVIERMLGSARIMAAEHDVTFDVAGVADDLPMVRTDAARLQRAFELAFLSALRVTHGGRLSFAARPDEPGRVALEIRGTALEPDAPTDTTEPWVSLVARLGLRLAIARRTLSRLGGRLGLDADDDGTTLRFVLPTAQNAPASN